MQCLASNVVRLRNDRDWTQQELANRCGCKSKFIGFIERRGSNVTLSTVALLLNGFGCTTAELFWQDAAVKAVPFHQGESMLTLIRSPQEAIHIGPDIRVDILGVYPDRRVQVGVTAPREIEIQQTVPSRVAGTVGISGAPEARVTVNPAVFPSIATLAQSAIEASPKRDEILAVLVELDQTLQAAQDAVSTLLQTTRGLLDLHAGLVEVRRLLEPLREQTQFLEEEARAIFHSTSELSGYERVMSQIRESGRVLDDLLFALPHQHRKPELARRSPHTFV
jgi:transcriptional regulator with XRE-family HTH domain